MEWRMCLTLSIQPLASLSTVLHSSPSCSVPWEAYLHWWTCLSSGFELGLASLEVRGWGESEVFEIFIPLYPSLPCFHGSLTLLAEVHNFCLESCSVHFSLQVLAEFLPLSLQTQIFSCNSPPHTLKPAWEHYTMSCWLPKLCPCL